MDQQLILIKQQRTLLNFKIYISFLLNYHKFLMCFNYVCTTNLKNQTL